MSGIDTYVFLHGVEDQRFQLVQAVVDASPATFLHDRFVALQKHGTRNKANG